MFKNFFKIAFRSIFSNKAYVLVNIAGLTIGLAVFLYILIYIHHELSYDEFHQGHERIYRVEQLLETNGTRTPTVRCPAPLAGTLVGDFDAFKNSTRVLQQKDFLVQSEKAQHKLSNIYFVDAEFLDIFSFPIIRGETEDALEDPFSAVLTKSAAKRLFGKVNVLGERLQFSNLFEVTITGIMEAPPSNTHMEFSALVSLSTFSEHFGENIFSTWEQNWMAVYAKLTPDASPENLELELKDYLKRYQGPLSKNELYLKPLERIHLHSSVNHELHKNGDINDVIIFSVIALLVLLVAGLNFTNLSTAYAGNRAREVAIRKVVGSSRKELIAQFVGETFVMILIALAASMVLAEVFMPYFNEIVNRSFSVYYFFKAELLALLLGVLIILTLIAGVYPAFVLSSFSARRILYSAVRQGSTRAAFRRILVVFQFFISISLIAFMLIVILQIRYLNNKDLGYNKENILYFSVQDAEKSELVAFREKLKQTGVVSHCSTHDYLPNDVANYTAVSWEGATKEDFIRMNVNYCDRNYLKTFGIGFIDGANFKKSAEYNQVIINQAAAEAIGWNEPVGKEIVYQADYRSRMPVLATITGVVENFHFESLHEPIRPLMLRQMPENMSGVTFSARYKGSEEKAAHFIRDYFKNTFPGQQFSYKSFERQIERMYENERTIEQLLTYFAFVALLIATLGLLGLVSFITRQRTKEIGIRKAIGAPARQIFYMIIREFIIMLIAASLLGWGVSFFAAQSWLSNYPYHIALTIWPFLAASAIAFAIALSVVSIEAVRAARENPAEALIYE